MSVAKSFDDRSGYSLVEVLISMGLVGLASVAMGNLLLGANKESRASQERMFKAEVQTHLRNTLGNADYCSCLFRSRTFNATPGSVGWNQPIADLKYGYDQPIPTTLTTACTSHQGVLVPAEGAPFPGIHIINDSVSVENYVPMGGGKYLAELIIRLRPSSLVRPLKPLKVPFSFVVNESDPVNAQRFVACDISSGGGANKVVKQGTQFMAACHSHNCCYTVTFSTPFSSGIDQVQITPRYQDWGMSSSALSFGVQSFNAAGFIACFDHIGENIDNDGEFYWTATGN